MANILLCEFHVNFKKVNRISRNCRITTNGEKVAEYESLENSRYGTRSLTSVGQYQSKFTNAIGTAPPGLQFRLQGKLGLDKS